MRSGFRQTFTVGAALIMMVMFLAACSPTEKDDAAVEPAVPEGAYVLNSGRQFEHDGVSLAASNIWDSKAKVRVYIPGETDEEKWVKVGDTFVAGGYDIEVCELYQSEPDPDNDQTGGSKSWIAVYLNKVE